MELTCISLFKGRTARTARRTLTFDFWPCGTDDSNCEAHPDNDYPEEEEDERAVREGEEGEEGEEEGEELDPHLDR
eukprot:1705124-Rhodomonas_salina.1